MAGNNFRIPQWTPELVNWSNAVHARNDANAKARQDQWNKIYDMVAAYGERRRAEDEAEKARQEQFQEAAIQRQFQAQEAEKARAFQAAENAKNRQEQNAYNASLKAQEEAKLKAKQFDAAQTEYANLLGKENPTDGDLMRMNQIRQSFPDVDKYNRIDANGISTVGSLYEDSQAHRQDKANKDYEFALFKATLPTTFNKQNPKEKTILDIKNGRFSDGTPFTEAQRTELLNTINGIKDLKTKTNESVQGAIAANAGNVQTQKLENAQAEQAVINKINSGSMLSGEERALALKLGYTWDKQLKKWVK